MNRTRCGGCERYHRIMTGHDVKRLRKCLGLTLQDLADYLDVHKVTLIRWEQRETLTRKQVRTLARLQ
jgi:DNA-binding transcriptional regulator YiaG